MLVSRDDQLVAASSDTFANDEDRADEITVESVRGMVRVNVREVSGEVGIGIDKPSNVIKKVGELLGQADINEIVEAIPLDEVRATEEYKMEVSQTQDRMRTRERSRCPGK